MKFEIEKQKIINLLKIPSFIIDANGINPILMGILLECKNQELIAISSNNNLSLKTSTKNLKIKTEGKILVQGKLLYNIVNKIKEKIINFEVVDNSIIRISTPTFSSDLNLLDNVGYPSINFIYQDWTKCVIKGEYLKNVITKLVNTTNVSQDRVTPLNGILFDSNRLTSYIESVGTDGHHLSYIKDEYSGEKFKIVIGVNILKCIEELITDKKEVNFYLKNQQLIIDINDILFNCRLLEGEYPSAIRAIETQQQFYFLINKQDIFNAIDRGLILASGDKKPSVLMNISSNMLKLSCRSIEYGSSYEEIPIKHYSGENIGVSFNVKYLLNLIKNIDNDEILFEFTDSNKHFFIKNPNNKNYTSLILPIRMI